MIPPTFLQELLSRVDVVDLVGRYVKLKRGGANWSGLCPFHAEKSPSFTVSPTKQFYHCFGCGAHGDAIRFLVEHNGMSFIDAVKDLAQQVGMTVPDDDRSPQQREQAQAQKERRATLSDVLAKATEAYRKQLRQSPRAIEYLKGRGLSGEIAARFGLGYAPEGWRSLASVFPSYDDPLLEESGLVIVQGEEDGDEAQKKRYDRFRDRVMFPIRSVQGDVIGFGGRVLDRGEPKYLNSPETPVFSKGRELYGLFEARAAIRERGYVLVVEGYMDVVALAQMGFGNAVATLGTACTPDHVHKLFRFTDSVVFSFDGDAAGRRAAGRALEASLPHATDTRTIRFLFLPSEHDPDSYVRELGAEAFEQRIAEAVPLSRQLEEQAAQGLDLDAAEGRAHMLANAKPLWGAMPEGALKRQLLARFAEIAHLDAAELEAMWLGRARPARDAAGRAPRDGTSRTRPWRLSHEATSQLDRAVWLLAQRTDLWATLDGEAHDLLAAQGAPYDRFFGCIERSLDEHGPLGLAAMLDELRHAAADDDDASAAAVLNRIARLHPLAAEIDIAVELRAVLDGLWLKAVDEELKMLMASGVATSPDARQRGQELNKRRAELKARLHSPIAH